MSEKWKKLVKIMEHIQSLVDELPLADEDVRKFLKTIETQIYQTEEGEWRMSFIRQNPTAFNMILKHGRGNHDNTYDPFYMLHEIKLAYSDKDVDRRVRQIASYFDALMFLYQDHDIQTALTEMRRHTETKQTVLGGGYKGGNLLFRIQSL